MCGSEESGSKHLVVSCRQFGARRRGVVGGGGGGWNDIMNGEQSELVKYLEWINSACRVVGRKGLVEKEEEGGEGERGEGVEDWFDLRSRVCRGTGRGKRGEDGMKQ